MAGRDRPPVLQSVPHALDSLPGHIDPVWAVYGSLIAPGRDGWSRAQLPHRRAHRVRGIAAIRHDPAWDSGHKGEEIEALWRLARLPGRERKAQRATPRIGNGMGLGAEAALAAAERFVVRAQWLGWVVPLFAAPAAFCCARRMVASMKTMPSAGHPAHLGGLEEALPDPELGPADEGLGG